VRFGGRLLEKQVKLLAGFLPYPAGKIFFPQRITANIGGKADAVIEVEGSSPGCAKASVEDTTGV
jgi:hypothetical protein